MCAINSFAFFVAAYNEQRMIDVLMNREGHGGVRAVHAAGGRVRQMLHAVMTGILRECEGSPVMLLSMYVCGLVSE